MPEEGYNTRADEILSWCVPQHTPRVPHTFAFISTPSSLVEPKVPRDRQRNARPKPRTTVVVVWRTDTQLPVPKRRPHTHPSRRKPMPQNNPPTLPVWPAIVLAIVKAHVPCIRTHPASRPLSRVEQAGGQTTLAELTPKPPDRRSSPPLPCPRHPGGLGLIATTADHYVDRLALGRPLWPPPPLLATPSLLCPRRLRPAPGARSARCPPAQGPARPAPRPHPHYRAYPRAAPPRSRSRR